MENLKEILLLESERMRKIKQKVRNQLADMSSLEGKLRISKRKNEVMYYHRMPGGKPNGYYLPKAQSELARRLAQKSYDEKIEKLVMKRVKQFERILEDYENDEIERIFMDENPLRQDLIMPVEETWEQTLEAWLKIPYQGKAFPENAPYIVTNKELRVRSKSEKIMADYFDLLGLRYKYECPLLLPPYGNVYPDFTFLSRQTGNEIYWEHEGMMDNPEYAQMAVKKIELYEKNGIYPGERLILTFETSVSFINTTLMKNLTEKYLKL